jgi:hypothetical protein
MTRYGFVIAATTALFGHRGYRSNTDECGVGAEGRFFELTFALPPFTGLVLGEFIQPIPCPALSTIAADPISCVPRAIKVFGISSSDK